MKNKRVLVTGGAGYVGTMLVPLLLSYGYEVRVVDLFLYGDYLEVHPNLQKMKGDIRKKMLMTQALTDVDSVIHLACISNDPSFELDPKLGKSINFDATKQLINLAREAGVKRFIYASSSSVYGVKSESEVTEDLPLAPLTDYSKYKVLSEQYLEDNAGDMPYVILRPATVCGYSPRLRLDLTVNILTIHALVNNKITVYGGRQQRPNIHINDMCQAYLLMLTSPIKKISGEIYNVGYENYSVLEIARMVLKVLGNSSISLEILLANDLRSYRVSSKKLFNKLGFKASHNIEEAIGDLSKAYIENKIQKPLTDGRYYNIRTMQEAQLE